MACPNLVIAMCPNSVMGVGCCNEEVLSDE